MDPFQIAGVTNFDTMGVLHSIGRDTCNNVTASIITQLVTKIKMILYVNLSAWKDVIINELLFNFSVK